MCSPPLLPSERAASRALSTIPVILILPLQAIDDLLKICLSMIHTAVDVCSSPASEAVLHALLLLWSIHYVSLHSAMLYLLQQLGINSESWF